MITLRNERKNPILDLHSEKKSFFKIVLISPVLFFMSGIVVLRGVHNRNMASGGEEATGAAVGEEGSAIEKVFSVQDVFVYNFFIWTTAYYLGLNFTHCDAGIM